MKVGRIEIRKYLDRLSKEQIIQEVLDLESKFVSVREYYHMKLNRDQNHQIQQKYKRIIRNEFFPDRGDGKLRLSIARKAISDYKKISTDESSVADLMIYYVENGVEFTNVFGDIDERFYSSMEKMFETALDYIFANKLEVSFEARCKAIVDDTRGIGWGFHDYLAEVYYESYGIEDL